MKPDHSAGAGMSRAAKKRAKKNNKKNDMTRDPVETEQAQSKKAKLAEKNEDPKLLKNSDEVSESDIDREMGMSRVEKEQERTTFVSGDSPSGIPSLPNSSLTDILMLTKGTDEASNKIIEELASTERAACLLQAILYPTTLDQFYSEYWEKKPLLARCSQKNKHRFSNLLSLQCIRKMSKREHLFYARDLNVTRYQKDKNGVKRRITLDKSPPDGSDNEVQVDTSELWSNYDNGCTIRLLCPHKQSDEVHALLSTLELELQCMVGANAYLTPPNSSQGFAPHYDDIEAFCLQLEGKKRWKVYEPTLKLPRVSSEDFTTQELEGVQPVLDIVLEEGDLLYMPRGWIHQACTIKDDNEHSLHLTVSAMQQWAWIDLLDVIVPEALENAAMDETSSTLREGLPRGFLEYMGVMYEEPTDEKLPESLKNAYDDDGNEERKFRRMLREKFRADVKKKLMKVNKTAMEMVDAACDHLAKRFLSERQPFSLTASEISQTSRPEGKDTSIGPSSLCRLVRPGVARLVIEDEKAVVYHCGDNSREHHGNPISPLEFEMDDGPAIEQLLTTVEPRWIGVSDLFHDSIEDKMAIAQSLYDEGILAIRD